MLKVASLWDIAKIIAEAAPVNDRPKPALLGPSADGYQGQNQIGVHNLVESISLTKISAEF